MYVEKNKVQSFHKKLMIKTINVSCRGVVDRPLALYPGVLSLVPSSPSLLGYPGSGVVLLIFAPLLTLSCLLRCFKPGPVPVEPLGAPKHKKHTRSRTGHCQGTATNKQK